MRRLTAAAMLLLLSCTEQETSPPEARDTPVPSRTREVQPPPTATIRLVAHEDPGLVAFVEGVRFAVDEVVGRGNLDLRLLQAPSVDAALGLEPEAVIVVGDPEGVTEARPAVEAARVPIVLIGGDLYSSRELFRYAFQTSVPYRWQARVTAKYLVADRGYDGIAVVSEARLGASTTDEMVRALAEEGATATAVISIGPEATASEAADAAASAGADAIFFQGATPVAAELSRELGRFDDPPQLALSAEALDASFVTQNQPPAGTVACYTYAWSGWADMLPRVHAFREAFADGEHYPASLEQEGYDAVMTLADALIRTGGAGGDRLVQELETFREETYALVPVRLGPDDHVLAEESHLGLFAVEEPVDAALPPGEASSLLPWRPIMRTFTTDGEKVNLLDRDKRIFFPFWRPKRPTPKYWRSEYGIVSRPSDQLH